MKNGMAQIDEDIFELGEASLLPSPVATPFCRTFHRSHVRFNYGCFK